MIHLLQGHSHLISEERKKADQLPGNSFGSYKGWACDIVLLIAAAQRFYRCCLSPPKRTEDYFRLVSYHICSHKANFSIYVFIPMFSVLFKSSMTERQMSKTTNTVNTSQIGEVNNAVERACDLLDTQNLCVERP